MDRLEAIGDPELRGALLFARSQARPVTADELAESQAVHRNVARGRLERLVEQAGGEQAVIATPTCPLRPLVRELPEAAEIDRGMWAGLVESALRDADAADVQCETRDCLDDHASCRVLLRLRPR